jgi:hypothetical protein
LDGGSPKARLRDEYGEGAVRRSAKLADMTTDPANAGREQDGRFSPGCSGNPAGKKAGTRHKATQAALALLSGEAEGLTRKAVELALAGERDGPALVS